MGKGEKKLLFFLSIIACFTFFAVIILTVMAYQIGVDKLEANNRSVIIGGLFSFGGGAIGALSAYLIARIQLTKQLELQDEKERKRILLEIKMKKAEEVLEILHQTKQSLFEMEDCWMNFQLEVTKYLIDRHKYFYEAGKNLNKSNLEVSRDEFLKSYERTYKYKSYFIELITDIEKCHSLYFKDLRENINLVLINLFYLPQNMRIKKTNLEVYNDMKDLFAEIDTNIVIVNEKILEQIKCFETELSEIYINFERRINL